MPDRSGLIISLKQGLANSLVSCMRTLRAPYLVLIKFIEPGLDFLAPKIVHIYGIQHDVPMQVSYEVTLVA